jgi:hypothetical protein
MKTALLIAALLAAGFATGSAHASNGLYITNLGDNLLNVATATAEGSGNALWITQTHDQPGAANTLSIDLHGDLNGGPTGSVFGGSLTASTGLIPGRVEQTGYGNAIGMHVTGSSNLFAITQIGASNTLTAMVNGNNNQAAVYQMGTGNALSYSQIGNGNMLSVVQRSW